MLWQIKQSHLYALLDRLESDGLLYSEMLPGEAFPFRRQYKLTEAGEQSLATWVAAPVEHARDMRQDFLARLYFAAQRGPDQATALIEKQAAVCQKWRENLERCAESLPPGSGYESQIIRFRLGQVSAILDWLEACEKEYAA
jgi:DNA-binding PadR family transcriptional regulator